MKFDWQIEADDISAVRELCDRMSKDALVIERHENNVLGLRRPRASRENIWKALVNSQITTQQKSGPDSAANRFITQSPFPLALSNCMANLDLVTFIAGTLESFRGLRRYNRIAAALSQNLTHLDGGGWSDLERRLKLLQSGGDMSDERRIANEIDRDFEGIGPKQARNFLQMLGVTRFEIPLDSRVIGWLNEHSFAFHLNAGALGDSNYYEVVMDGVQALCAASDVLPCIFDASVFASLDPGGWNAAALMWVDSDYA